MFFLSNRFYVLAIYYLITDTYNNKSVMNHMYWLHFFKIFIENSLLH